MLAVQYTILMKLTKYRRSCPIKGQKNVISTAFSHSHIFQRIFFKFGTHPFSSYLSAEFYSILDKICCFSRIYPPPRDPALIYFFWISNFKSFFQRPTSFLQHLEKYLKIWNLKKAKFSCNWFKTTNAIRGKKSYVPILNPEGCNFRNFKHYIIFWNKKQHWEKRAY